MKKIGLSCAPADAVQEVIETAEFISSKNGGRGAIREMCDFILKSTGKYDLIMEKFFNRD